MASIRDLILNVIEKKEGDALTAAANDLDKLGKGLDVNSEKTKQFTKDSAKLNAEIEKSSARIKDLHKQFAATGDTSLFGDIRKEESNLRNLRKTLQVLATDAHDVGKDAGQSLFGGIASGFQGAAGTPVLGPILAGAILGAVAGVLPALGAIIAGAVSGIGAVGGVAGGVLSAIKDPVVKSAFSEFGADISREFFKGSDFIEPIRKSLALLERDFAGLNLDEAFAKVAPDVEILARGLAALVGNTMPGFNKLLDRSGPIISEFADGLASVGVGLSDFIDDVSSSRGTLDGLEAFFLLLKATLQGLGNTLHWLSDIFHDVIEKNEQFFRAQAKLLDLIGAHGQADNFKAIADNFSALLTHGDEASTSIKGLGDAFAGAANPTEHYAQVLSDAVKAEQDFIGLNLDLDKAIIDAAQGFADLNKNLIDGKGNWDNNTQAGRDNQKAILDQIDAIERVRLAEIAKSDGSVEAINKINTEYDKNLAKILGIAAAAGDAQTKIEALAKKYFIDVIVTVEQRIQQNQLVKANAVDRALQNLMGFASGGIVPGPVGAPLVAVVHGGERVLTPAQQASGSGGQPMQVSISFAASGDSVLDSILLAVRKYVRINGGDVQTALMN